MPALLAISVLRGRSRSYAKAGEAELIEELDEADWPAPLATDSSRPARADWLFQTFFLCMAVAALPLVGIRWTGPEALATWGAYVGALALALPVILPLPFLLTGCVVTLAVYPASRTPAALGFLGVALAIGLAGLYAVSLA